MSLISSVIGNTITSLSEKQIPDIEVINGYVFYECSSLKTIVLPNSIKSIENSAFEFCSSLTSINIPSSVEKIGFNAFSNCASLSDIQMSDTNPYIMLSVCNTDNAFSDTAWYSSQPEETLICIVDGKILLGNKIKDPKTTGYNIPSSVVNMASYCCKLYYNTDSYKLSSVIVPDTVEVVQGHVFDGHEPTSMTIGSSVRLMLASSIEHTTTTLIFRQPAGMYIDLPTPGDGSGLTYDKSSRNVSIYTDNEYIRNYGWSTDNVTATFYPLSEAPV